MRTGVPCNENRFFPVRISTQGKPCSDPVLAMYGIAAYVPPSVKYKLIFMILKADNDNSKIVFTHL